MKLVKLLANLGYGSRKDVTRLIRNGWLTRRDGSTVGLDDDYVHDDLLVDDEPTHVHGWLRPFAWQPPLARRYFGVVRFRCAGAKILNNLPPIVSRCSGVSAAAGG